MPYAVTFAPDASLQVSERADVTRVARCVCGHVECVLALGSRHLLSEFMVVLEQLVALGPLESSGYQVLARERDDGLGKHGVGSALFIELVVLSPDEARTRVTSARSETSKLASGRMSRRMASTPHSSRSTATVRGV